MMPRRLAALLALSFAACGGAAEPTPASGAAKTDAPAPAVASSDEPAKQGDLCKAFDRDRVAGVLGWGGLARVSSVSSNGGGKATRSCSYADKDRAASTHLGVIYSSDVEFEAVDVGYKLEYGPHPPVAGAEARIARSEDKVLLQVVRGDLRIKLTMSSEGVKASELEPKISLAAGVVLETLPASAGEQLRRD